MDRRGMTFMLQPPGEFRNRPLRQDLHVAQLEGVDPARLVDLGYRPDSCENIR
jgi:hypothetical protein